MCKTVKVLEFNVQSYPSKEELRELIVNELINQKIGKGRVTVGDKTMEASIEGFRITVQITVEYVIPPNPVTEAIVKPVEKKPVIIPQKPVEEPKSYELRVICPECGTLIDTRVLDEYEYKIAKTCLRANEYLEGDGTIVRLSSSECFLCHLKGGDMQRRLLDH